MKISVKLAGLPMEIGLQHDEYRFVFAPFASEEPPMAFAAISPDELVRAMHMVPVHSVEEGLRRAREILGSAHPRITAIPDGVSVWVQA